MRIRCLEGGHLGWLVARGYQLPTPRRLKIVTPILIWTGLLAFYGVRF
jgi:hypothetical protein